jgi:hypothetical protein
LCARLIAQFMAVLTSVAAALLKCMMFVPIRYTP